MDKQLSQLFRLTLEASHKSLTKSRSAIFDLLVGHEAQSMQELIIRGNKGFDRVTLYRTIDLFEKLGITKRVYFGWKYKIELGDKFTYHHHHHLICLACGKVLPIAENSQVEDLINQLAKQKGFQPSAHQLEIQGYCQSCYTSNI
jgi:Fur family ferric uptake transcriptional regulator